MSKSEINFKAYFVDEENSEVKRFSIDGDTVTSFVFMEEKLKCVFPSLRYCDFKINWKDGDGDLVSISNDEDIITALTEMNFNPKVLYINTKPKKSTEAPPVFRVFCDVCQNGISGYRYKCIECPDYDLCSTCESNGNHSEHMVLRLPNSNTSFAKVDRKMMYNAARALKKSAVQAHRCAYKDSFKTGENKDKQPRGGEACSSSKTSGCPFAAADVNALINQNITPIVEMLSQPAKTTSDKNQGAPNSLADLIHSVLEAFTGSVITEPTSTSPNKTTSQEQTNGAKKEKQDDSAQSKSQNSQPQPSAPTANSNGQEMEWTIVGDNEQDSTSQASASSKVSATTVQPPQPPQDPRLMRGLAQLHEMGFSNENNFLNYLLELHNYDVASAVKAILQLK